MAFQLKTSKQAFEVGEVVKIGFVSGLQIIKKIATPGDYRPDFYVMRQAATGRWYAFQPHHGLTRCESLADAMSAFA